MRTCWDMGVGVGFMGCRAITATFRKALQKNVYIFFARSQDAQIEEAPSHACATSIK